MAAPPRPGKASSGLSRALSLVLRHAAHEHKLSIDTGGWARVDDITVLPVIVKRIITPRSSSQKQRQQAAAAQTVPFDVLPLGQADIVALVLDNNKQRFAIEWRVGDELVSKESNKEEVSLPLRIPDLESWRNREAELCEQQAKLGRVMYMRANQGHSISVPDLELERINVDDLVRHPREIIHGTTIDAWELIRDSGCLRKMTRNHIHFAPCLDTLLMGGGVNASNLAVCEGPGDDAAATVAAAASAADSAADSKTTTTRHEAYDRAVASSTTGGFVPGLRPHSKIGIIVDLHAAVRAGVPFFVSHNGVVLTVGVDASGELPLHPFVLRVLNIATNDPITGWPILPPT